MKILAIASAGGHWIQLLRLQPSFEGHEVVFMSTKTSFASTVSGYKFLVVPDANRKNPFKMLSTVLSVFKHIKAVKPHIIITTGAAPGLIGIVIGKLFGIKTAWVDSIANVQTISMSGKIARYFATKIYTQWPDLATKGTIYRGNVLS
ncbi:oligosaccharide biosynthesis protein Alg14 [Arcticibacter pallidicorallinus]|uniref:Oligosaccharide biosynthesis protein Alg14 n=1 Tax=Arcticibacter pallidicorallinus TaxID=1259464 RepID=A0A2T0UBM8_9SPHI|nr:oligosaccharide biosynthesis protein Alg14 [Arcticibacter pallidicorallinus]PRY55294.1 oligosaccharide biosynthesis protein Alg14 [Arcticibacter pallidicorallinus]